MSLDKDVQSIPARVEELEAKVRELQLGLQTITSKHSNLVIGVERLADIIKGVEEKGKETEGGLQLLALSILVLIEGNRNRG